MVELSDKMSDDELRDLLEYLHDKYNTPDFIAEDPISVPHSFAAAEDREIAGLLASTIAWGNRRAIVQSAHRMMRYMDNAPYDFVVNATEEDIATLNSFVHRTFNGGDFRDFVLGMRHIIKGWGSIGGYFEQRYRETGDIRRVLAMFREDFFAVEHNPHSEKHVSNICRGAACKRLCMYLRWFVRRDSRGVDFGLWGQIPMSALYLPLDLHTGRVGRALGLLNRKQDDWRAVEQITERLAAFSKDDPTRYDYALFGAGISGVLKNGL